MHFDGHFQLWILRIARRLRIAQPVVKIWKDPRGSGQRVFFCFQALWPERQFFVVGFSFSVNCRGRGEHLLSTEKHGGTRRTAKLFQIPEGAAREMVQFLDTFVRFSVMHGKTHGPVTQADQEVLANLHKEYNMRDRSVSVVPPAAFVDQFAVAGPPERCIGRIRRSSTWG